MTSEPSNDILLEVDDLTVAFRGMDRRYTPVVQGVSLRIERGQTVGLVGESGSGKSVTALSVLRLLAEPPARVRGRILLHRDTGPPVDIAGLAPTGRQIRAIRGNEIAMIFQEPMRAFSPVFTIGHQIAEAVWLHRSVSRAEARRLAAELLERVGIADAGRRIRQHPHELSGGQLQRGMIAMALACRPRLLIADEPTTALDVTIQAQILALLKELQAQLDLAILLITHDLGIVAHHCRTVLVMYMGRIVERADVRTLFRAPRHPYTRKLLESIPVPGRGRGRRLPAIAGAVPDPAHVPPGCAFGPRCDRFEPGLCDRAGAVPMVELEEGHRVCCYKAGEGAEEATKRRSDGAMKGKR